MNPQVVLRTPSPQLFSNQTIKQRLHHQPQERKANRKESLQPSFKVATRNNSRLRSSPRLNLYQRKPIALHSSKTLLLRIVRMILQTNQTRTKLKLISSKKSRRWQRKNLLHHRLARLSSYLKSLSNSFSSANRILPSPTKLVDLQQLLTLWLAVKCAWSTPKLRQPMTYSKTSWWKRSKMLTNDADPRSREARQRVTSIWTSNEYD